MSTVLADTGALVALLDRREQYHGWAVDQAHTITPPLLLCDAVLAETCFLLADVPGSQTQIRRCLESGAWRLDFDLASQRKRVFDLMETYADQPMSLADACLVRMSELHEGAAVFTLDRHFRIYRRNRRQVLPVIMPADI